MSLKTKNGKIILCISVILIISIIINIFQIMIISEYRQRVGSITYNNVINVKNTNISNNDILLKSIETSTIEITDLLKLYKNYGVISNNIMSLWDEYNFYKNNNYIFIKKEIKTDVTVVNEIHSRMEEYLNSLKLPFYLLQLEIHNLNNLIVFGKIPYMVHTYLKIYSLYLNHHEQRIQTS